MVAVRKTVEPLKYGMIFIIMSKLRHLIPASIAFLIAMLTRTHQCALQGQLQLRTFKVPQTGWGLALKCSARVTLRETSPEFAHDNRLEVANYHKTWWLNFPFSVTRRHAKIFELGAKPPCFSVFRQSSITLHLGHTHRFFRSERVILLMSKSRCCGCTNSIGAGTVALTENCNIAKRLEREKAMIKRLWDFDKILSTN